MPRTTADMSPVLTPYDEQLEWTQLWEACVAMLDRYPHIRPTPRTWSPALHHVTIPQAAFDVADVHFHLE